MANDKNLTPWKPGQPSPNPSGRPQGSRNLSTILRDMLEEEIDVVIDGVKTKQQFKESIISKLIKKANNGNLRAIEHIMDRMEGKAIAKIVHEVETVKTFTIIAASRKRDKRD